VSRHKLGGLFMPSLAKKNAAKKKKHEEKTGKRSKCTS
jgi:hypothetical protein